MDLPTLKRIVGGYLSRAEAQVARRRDPHGRALVAPRRTPLPTVDDRAQSSFDRGIVTERYQRGVEIEGRLYNYVLYPGTGDTLCIHFSAFFGEWGDRREWRPQFQGYFHRLRMLWPLTQHHFLFLCDTFGPDRNGTYYKGENGDFFVERAMDQIITEVRAELGLGSERVVTAGSSMGGTAALRFALRHRLRGAVAVTPHIDLDLSARFQGRERHVASIVARHDLEAPDLESVMREICTLAGSVAPLPRVVVQSMRDDRGVHYEQVEPFAEIWRGRGGSVRLDVHETGGHTSEYATPEFFAESIRWCLAGPPTNGAEQHV